MSSEKPNFLSQPVVKNIFMFRNGDPYYEARRIVINQKRVSNFETLLREVTGGIQAPFGAVRNIYTPRGGHKVDCLESLQSGEQYVAAGRERFKKMDYLQIGSRRRRLLQTLPVQAKPLPQNRIVVSARFLKPIKEPCTIFVVANGDVLNPALRLLIHQRMLGQFDRILEMITERMGLRVLGGVRSLYTYEGHQVTDGNLLESGQLYVAVGREKFKKLSYSDLLFTKPRGTRRVNGMKANSLPPIYRFSKQNGNGNSKSTVPSSDSGGGDSKASLQGHSRNNKEHLSSIVREISQARLISLRKKRSGQSMTLTISDNDDQDSKGDDGITDGKTPQDQPAEPAEEGVKAEEEKHEKAGEQEETAADNTKEEEEEEASSSKADEEEQQETNSDKENGEEKREGETTKEEKESEVTEKKESEVQNNEKEGEPTEENENTEQHNKQEEEITEKRKDEEANDDKDSEEPAGAEEKDGEEIKEVKEVMHENKEEVKSEEQGSSSSTVDKSEDSKEKEDGSHTSSEGEKDERGKSTDEEKQDKDSEKKEKSSKELNNDVDTGEEQTVTENSNDPGKTQPDNETKDNDNDRSNSSNSNQEEEGRKTREGATKESGEEEGEENGEVGGEDDEVESEAEPDTEGKKSTEVKDTAAKEEKGEGGDEESGDNRKRED